MHILSVKFRQGKVTKFWLNGKYFYPTNIIIKESKFPGERDKIYLFFSHECSIQRPNFKVGVILVQHQ